MRYERVVPARFIARPNRFIAHVELDGRAETVHVKNTGRCRELLVPGARVYLADAGANAARRTRYDLIAVERGSRLINMDSQAPNAAALEFLRAGNIFPPGTEIKPEFRYGPSRFDFSAFTPALALLEVKGVTLVETRSAPPGPMGGDVALFPDAPTARGAKHLRELAAFAEGGGAAYVLFVIQTAGVAYFAPNEATDQAFAAALRGAAKAGVRILAYDCRVTPESMALDAPVPVRL